MIYKYITDSFHLIRKSEDKKATHPIHSIKVVLCGLKTYFILRKTCISIILVFNIFFYQNWLINECARKNLAKRALCGFHEDILIIMKNEYLS